MKKLTKEHLDFATWADMLRKMARAHYGFEFGQSYIYSHYYENGYTPREALDHEEFCGGTI